MGPITFLPPNTNIGEQSRPNRDKDTKYLMESHIKYVHKKVEKGDSINVETVRQEMEQELDKINNTNGEINLYHDIIVNKAEKDDTLLSQMEQWSILSNTVNNVQYDRHPRNFYDLEIKAIDYKGQKKRHSNVE